MGSIVGRTTSVVFVRCDSHAIGLKNEKASKGAIASFLIATPQTGIDSILATFSLMGLGFAIIRPVAALITGVCGGLLVTGWFVRMTRWKNPMPHVRWNVVTGCGGS